MLKIAMTVAVDAIVQVPTVFINPHTFISSYNRILFIITREQTKIAKKEKKILGEETRLEKLRTQRKNT